MTNNVVSSNPTHGEVYLIQHHVIKFVSNLPGADPGFQDMGGHLKKMRRAEGGTKNFGVFRVKKGGVHAGCPPPWIRPCWQQVGGFLYVIWFPPPIKQTGTI
jgi:hypothetical protein